MRHALRAMALLSLAVPALAQAQKTTPAPTAAATPAAPPQATAPAPAPAPTPAPQTATPAQGEQNSQGSRPQTPAGQPAQAAPSGQAAPATPPPPPVDTFTYSPDGRRDPFVSLIGTGSLAGDARPTGRRAEGAGGFTVNEISVRGILQSRGTLVAMIQGPDNRTYVVRQGDKLLDGTIKNVTAQGLIVVQEVNDPLSLVKQREVSKLLRSLEGVK